MNCSNCGTEYQANFCPNCGAPASGAAAATATATQVPNIIINNVNTNVVGGNVSPKSKIVALLLCLFLGYFGAHRFYVGKTGSGILYFLTGGLFVIGALVDLISIITGGFRDANGMFLK